MKHALMILVAFVAVMSAWAEPLSSCAPDSFDEFWSMTQGQPDEMRLKSMIAMMSEGLEEGEDCLLLDEETGRLVFVLHVKQETFDNGELGPDKLDDVKDYLLPGTFMAVEDVSFCEFLRIAVTTGHDYEIKLQAIENPSLTASFLYTTAEVLDVCDKYEKFCAIPIEPVRDDGDTLEFEGIDAGALREDTTDLIEEFEFPAVNMEMFEDAPTSLELMMANYYWDNEDAGNPNRIWREDDLVIASFVVGPDEKAEIASFLVSEEDTANFGYGLLISLIGHIDGPLTQDDDFDWMTFFCLVVTLDYDMDFHLMDSPDDTEPLVIHMPVSQLESIF